MSWEEWVLRLSLWHAAMMIDITFCFCCLYMFSGTLHRPDPLCVLELLATDPSSEFRYLRWMLPLATIFDAGYKEG